jgi:hypothetical protein
VKKRLKILRKKKVGTVPRGEVLYAEYRTEAKYAFVRHPLMRGAWLRVHRSANFTACMACGAQIGEPCYNQATGFPMANDVHPVRKDVFYKRTSEQLAAEQFREVRREAVENRTPDPEIKLPEKVKKKVREFGVEDLVQEVKSLKKIVMRSKLRDKIQDDPYEWRHQKMLALKKAGWTRKQIGELFGCSENTVTNYLKARA